MNVSVRPAAAVDPRLVRAYRLLSLIYPRGPRRAELLDTLVECAAPGRRRPAAREVANLVWHGSRARLGRPASRGVVVLALFIVLVTGFLGAAAANRLGWQAVGSLPVGAEGAEIRDTVFPGLQVWGGGDAAKFVRQVDNEGIGYGYAVSWVKQTPATRDVAAYTAAARARLVAAGWTVTGADPPLDESRMEDANPADARAGFTAVRGGLGLHFIDYYYPGGPAYDSDGDASYLIWHLQPWWLTAVSWLGAVPAAVLAWLLTGWVSRRLEPSGTASAVAAAGGILFVLGLTPAALPVLLAPLFDRGPADETSAPFWELLTNLAHQPAMFSGVVALLLVGGAAAYRSGPWLRDLRSHPPALVAVLVALTLTIGLGLYRVAAPNRAAGKCTPSVPSGVVDPPSARLSQVARIFISPRSTDDQRNLTQAAIFRGNAQGDTFTWDPSSPDFTAAFCARGRLPAEAIPTLPYFWTVDLASPGLFGGLAAEVMVMPGVVAVQHVPAS